MFKSANYNNIHDKTVPKLKRGDTVIFKCLYMHVDDSGTPTYPTYIVPNKDVIYDHMLDEYVDIAYIKSPVVPGREEELGQIVFGSADKGVLVLSGNNPDDVRKYEFLKLCNFNQSNPDRDGSQLAIFKEINETVRVADSMRNARKDLEILRFATEAPIDDLIQYLKANQVNPLGLPEERIRAMALDKLKQTGMTNVPGIPQERTTDKSPTDTLESKIKEMLDADIIYYDAKSQYYRFRDGDTEIARVFKVVKDKPAALAKEINNNIELKEQFFSLVR